jgi:glycosyltransferase involved in cell wall biosynthesis
VVQLATALHARGWRVTLVALSGQAQGPAAVALALGIGFVSLGMRKGLADPRGWYRFWRWLREHQPDIVHAHLPHAVWLARWSRLAAPMRVLVDTLHTSSTGPMARRLGYRFSRFLPDKVTAVSDAVAIAYLQAGMVGQRELVVLPNGVDMSRWVPDVGMRKASRRALGLGDEFLWLAAGRLDAVKDYPTLLHAVAGVPDAFVLLIAGAGPLEFELRKLADQLGLKGHVRFLGYETNVSRWMQAADGFVLSSQWEGLPMALLEAAACALPCVATDVAGTREAVVDGVTGLLAAAGTVRALSDAMQRLMQMPPAQRTAMGLEARQMASERFSLEAVVDRWEGLYGELLQANASVSRMRRSRLKSNAQSNV